VDAQERFFVPVEFEAKVLEVAPDEMADAILRAGPGRSG
jgi:hypothetical protein